MPGQAAQTGAGANLLGIITDLQVLSTADLTGFDSEQLVVLVNACARCERLLGDELARRHQSFSPARTRTLARPRWRAAGVKRWL